MKENEIDKETSGVYVRVPKVLRGKLQEVKDKTNLSLNTIVLQCIKLQYKELLKVKK